MQIRKLSFKIIYSTTLLLPAWVMTLEDFDLPVKMIPRDCVTRWNSSFDMANFVLEYQVPIDDITDKRRLGLTAYALDEHEWELLCQLQDVLKVHVCCLFGVDVTNCDTLQILKDAMLFFSRATPNLAMVLPTIDYINETFTTNILQKEALDPAI